MVTGRGRVGAFRLYGTQEKRRPGDVTGEQRGGGGSSGHGGKEWGGNYKTGLEYNRNNRDKV